MEAPAVTVNGRRIPLAGATPDTTALEWLRGRGLTGCKEGCAEGECGACSVLVARPGLGSPTEWTALNACLVPVAALDGQELVTAEGLGAPGALHPVQLEIAVRGGSQCGYCTPGFVCSMAAEYYRAGRGPDDAAGAERGPNGFDLHALSGNLCRCTGYRPLRDAAYALGPPPEDDPLARRQDAAPPAIPATRLSAEGREFVRPADLAQALALIGRSPEATVLAGSTDWGVEVNLRGARPALVVAVDRLEELRGFAVDDTSIEIGAGLTLTEVERRLEGRVPLLTELFDRFASRLIRNAATIGGNLGTASPIGDAAPALLALDATVLLVSAEGEREVSLADYFVAYRQTVRRPDELIRAVRVPTPVPRITSFLKIAKRRFDDISSVAVGVALDVEDDVVVRARIGLGGVADRPIRARATEEVLTGRPWSSETARRAADVMAGEGTPLSDHRASAAYRRAMLRTALLKVYSAAEGTT